MKTGPKPQKMENRFWSKVEMIPFHECWEWTSNKTIYGYGLFKINREVDNKSAHRMAWEMTYGSIPKGLFVLHSCDNRGCVRPYHLRLGTHQDNMDDKVKRNRCARLVGELNPMHRINRSKRIPR